MKTSLSSPRSLLLVAFACTALGVAAGCGGGGSSSSGGGGGGGAPIVSTPSPSPAPSSNPQSLTRTVSITPGATPSVTFSPIPLPSVGMSTIGVGAPPGNTSTTLTLTVQTTLPTGVATPSSVARAPQSTGGQNIVPLAYISASTALQTVSQASPTFSISFTNALAASYDYIYVAQYSATTGWSMISTGVVGSGRTSATFPAFSEPLTFNSVTKTWFLIFTAQNVLASPTPAPNPTSVATSAPSSAPSGATPAPLPDALQFLPSGFYGEVIASGLPAPRQLVALPNGDLLFGTDDKSGTVWIVPNADPAGDSVGTPRLFATVPNVSTQEPAQGLAFDPTTNMIYIATNQSVWQVPYHTGDQSEPTSAMVEIAKVRRGPVSPTTDGDIHYTSSVAVVPGQTLYVGVGSSCNACVETDPTRGTIQQVNLTSKVQSLKAARFRNPLAMTVNPATNTLWAGGAGQDDLIALNGSIVIGSPTTTASGFGHPYEFFDPVTLHSEGTPDYGWPMCEEDNHIYNPLGASPANCNSTVVNGALDVEPRVELWAYSTIIGAVFYPTNVTGMTYPFPSTYRGSAFLSMHGSWHENPDGIPLAVPQVIYVPMSGDTPSLPVNYTNSGAQWHTLLYGFQDPTTGNRIGRPVGLAVGKNGSLFVADDYAGVIYRIRPGTAPAANHRRAR